MKQRVRRRAVLALGGVVAAGAAALSIALAGGASAAGGPSVDWPYWGGTTQATRYANINQINTTNVSKLGVAFTLKAGPNQVGWETDPQEVGGVLYYTTPTDQVFAVNATTGKKMWEYTPKVNFFLAIAGGGGGVPNSRGVTIANGKVYDLTFDDQLIALQQSTGEKLWSARIANANNGISESAPGTIWNGEYIVGGAESDAGIRGSVQAFNANNGKLLWRTWLVPKPGQGWMPKTGEHGGGDVWMPPTIDTKTGTVFVGTGNPSPDENAKIRPGCNKWTNATVALNAKTGKLEWGHSEFCNDAWDYDSHQAPLLYTITQNGTSVPVVGQVNKSGFFSVLNEQTGKLITKSPYVEPFSIPHRAPNAKGVKVCPGPTGGIEFGPTSMNPQTGLAYVQGENECYIYTLQSAKQTATHHTGQPDFGGSFAPAPGKFTGSFDAINATTGKIAWKDPLPMPAEGGSMTTSGNLVFFGDGETPTSPKAKLQGALYAANATNGKVLWKANLGVPITAAPMTYEVNGVQYVALAADSDLVVFKLGGTKVKTLKPNVPQVSTPKSNLPKLATFKKAGPYEWYKASTKQVVYKMVGGVSGKNSGFNYDGYYGGQANFEVPLGWSVTLEFSNASGVPHSLEITDSLKLPLKGIVNAFGAPQAVPANPVAGVKKGAGIQVISYSTTKSGQYYLVCGVIGHAKAGMWDRMTVSSSVKTPKIVVGKPTKKFP